MKPPTGYCLRCGRDVYLEEGEEPYCPVCGSKLTPKATAP